MNAPWPHVGFLRLLIAARGGEHGHVSRGEGGPEGRLVHGEWGAVHRRCAGVAGVEQDQHPAVLGKLQQFCLEVVDRQGRWS